MGQKTNPNIFRLGKTITWKSKYFEKKTTEIATYSLHDVEMKSFVCKFFSNNGLTIHNCKINYLPDNSVHFYISYYTNMEAFNKITLIHKNQQIKIVKQTKGINKKDFYQTIKKTLTNYTKYHLLKYNQALNCDIQKQNYKHVRNKILLEKKRHKIRRMHLIKYYKQHLAIQKYKSLNKIQLNSFFNTFFESLCLYLKKQTKIYLTMKQLNKEIKTELNPENTKALKKILVTLKKYKQNDFFKEGINIMFLATSRKNSTKLLADYIGRQLSNLKRHNFFLKFVSTTLEIFGKSIFSSIKGIKIKVKGRFNGAPRAKHKILTVGYGVPVLSINSKIDYAEKTAFTSNGTFGVKIWICEN